MEKSEGKIMQTAIGAFKGKDGQGVRHLAKIYEDTR